MSDTTITWPTKSREWNDILMDSTIWDDFKFRDGDIVIATWAKSGTTWTQQIVGQLVFNGAEGLPVMDLAPWIDMHLLPTEEILARVEAQTHRRFVKTHLPADALVVSPKAKYIYIARDGRDAVWSWYNHHAILAPEAYELMNNNPAWTGDPWEPPIDDIRQYFHNWLDRDGYPMHPFWENIQTWWNIRNLPNVLLLHFNDMKADMEREIRRIAEFLNIEVDDETWPTIVEHCTFDYMKSNAPALSPEYNHFFDGGLTNFVFKGTNGRWHDTLTAEDIEKYERHASENLTPDCAHWLATGERRD